MVSVAPIISQPPPPPVGEKRFLFRSLDWQRYQTLRKTLSQERNVRFIYMHGTLEVTRSLEIHEFSARLIEKFIWILVVELGMKVKTMGSTTLVTSHVGWVSPIQISSNLGRILRKPNIAAPQNNYGLTTLFSRIGDEAS